jgi:signal transduction histidine kinase
MDAHESTAHFRHDLNTALTIVSARAQLLGRAVHRSPTLSDGERAVLLAGLAEIESAVRNAAAVIERMSAPRAPRTHRDSGA